MVFESGDGPTVPPAALQGFLKVMVGMEWPEGNVRSLRAVSQAWSDFVPVAKGFAEDVRARAADLDRSMDGEYAQEMVEYLRSSIARNVDELAVYAGELSASTRTAAADVEKAQILLIAAAVMTLAQIAFLAASLIFSWMIPLVQAAAQLTMRMVVQQLLAKLATLGLEKLSWEG
ncbi:WXG100-like domain-containing protein, partial [Amycolatopsis japonica]